MSPKLEQALARAKYPNLTPTEQFNRTDHELVYRTEQACCGVLLAQRQVQVSGDAVKTTVEPVEQQ